MQLGFGNWNIKYTENDDGITILRAVTGDRDAVLPDRIDGKPVTELAPYAMGPRDRSDEDEGKWIHSGAGTGAMAGGHGDTGNGDPVGSASESEGWKNDQIVSLCLPESLRRIGSYALMDLSDVERLEIWDTPLSWGTDACLNWFGLHRIIVHGWQGGRGSLDWVCGNFSNELDVSLIPDEEREEGRVRLLFPEYMEIWTENTPARQIGYNIDGFGYPYHHLFHQGKLDLGEYDREWPYALKNEAMAPETVRRLAWYRLHWPAGLSAEHREQYLDYVKKNSRTLLEEILREGSPAELRHLVKLAGLSSEVLQEGCALARELGKTQSLAVLMEAVRGTAPAGRRKSYDL